MLACGFLSTELAWEVLNVPLLIVDGMPGQKVNKEAEDKHSVVWLDRKAQLVDLGSLTRDQVCSHCSGAMQSTTAARGS